jgi:NADH dehydrogenase
MKVIIVGGGFAGINMAKRLADNKNIRVTLVDKNNYHFFPPLLYQVATSFIEPSNISYPFRRMFQHKDNLRFHMGVLQRINRENNTIETDTGTLRYDYLVLAMGTETNYFGMENLKRNAFPMKTVDDALVLRNQILLNAEKAVRTKDPAERERLLTIVVAGGGPTGVEVSGMIAEMSRNILKKDYPEFGSMRGHIYLVNSGNALLGPMSEKSQEEALKVLLALGVKVKLNTAVKDYADEKVVFGNGESINTPVLIWATGVIAREAPGLAPESVAKYNRIKIDNYCKVQGTENIYAIGDQSVSTADERYPNGHPQLAQVAIQQGKFLAKHFKRLAADKPVKPFYYRDKGSMAIIAKYEAVVDLPKGFFKGFVAWFVWLFIHIIPIAGFRNKGKLAFNWFWSFVTNDPTLRLILRPRKDR